MKIGNRSLRKAAIEYSKHNGVMPGCSDETLIGSHIEAFERGARWLIQSKREKQKEIRRKSK